MAEVETSDVTAREAWLTLRMWSESIAEFHLALGKGKGRKQRVWELVAGVRRALEAAEFLACDAVRDKERWGKAVREKQEVSHGNTDRGVQL